MGDAKLAASTAMLIMLTGCGFGNFLSKEFYGTPEIQGAKASRLQNAAQEVDIPTIVRQETKDAPPRPPASTVVQDVPVTPDGQSADAQRLEEAERTFYELYGTRPDSIAAKLSRRRIQDKVVAASNAACEEYKKGLNAYNQQNNFAFGGLSTLFGGLGAIFTAASVARPLSGAAGITSGIRSEFNADMFAQQTVQVVTNGIDGRRSRIARTMACHANDSLLAYPLERAIAQAFQYHGACSLNGGLQEAALQTSIANATGLSAAEQTVQIVNRIYAQTHQNNLIGGGTGQSSGQTGAGQPGTGGQGGATGGGGTTNGGAATGGGTIGGSQGGTGGTRTADANAAGTTTETCAALLALEGDANPPTSAPPNSPAVLAARAGQDAASDVADYKAVIAVARNDQSLAKQVPDLDALSRQLDRALSKFTVTADGYAADKAGDTGKMAVAAVNIEAAGSREGANKAVRELKGMEAKVATEALTPLYNPLGSFRRAVADSRAIFQQKSPPTMNEIRRATTVIQNWSP